MKSYRIDGQKGYGPEEFLNHIKLKVIDLINQKKKPFKVEFIYCCNFEKKDPATGKIEKDDGFFHTFAEVVTLSTDLFELFDASKNFLLKKVDEFQKRKTGWVFDHVVYFDIDINPFVPFVGSSYIPLPLILELKKAIINVKNENDHECFKWAITSAVFPKKKDPQRLNKQMRENSEKFNWKGIEFPLN